MREQSDPKWKEHTKVTSILTGRFAKNLKEYRIAGGLSQAQLAIRMEVTAAYVAMLEGAGRTPSVAVIEKAAKVLDIDPARLLR